MDELVVCDAVEVDPENVMVKSGFGDEDEEEDDDDVEI